MFEGDDKHRPKCPWCRMPPSEHESFDGYLSRVYACENGPREWRGVFTDEPVERGLGPACGA